MAELLETQYRSAKDLLCLNVIFFIFIGSFATFAYITYAGQCAAFKRYDEAFFALLRIIMGDLDYDSMKRSFPVLTPILIVCYVFVIFFVMLNMYLAVVSDAYATVVEEGLDERFIMSEFFSDAYYRLLRLIKPIKKPEKTEQIKNYLEWQKILQKRGYSETEVNASFAKFNIEKCDEINGEKQKMIENDLSKNMPQNGLQIDSDIKQYVFINI
uniref:Polycystin cation channel PKD1/PKD2 domain-containing protein n=1 Tax=Panagrolaimus superbus TaxID=310955 RepID=A0A914YEP7_9BILA